MHQYQWEKLGGKMQRIKRYFFLHLTVVLFSFAGVFSKFASISYNNNGLTSPLLYVFILFMLIVCVIYAFMWQKIIKMLDLNVAYANRTAYLIWSQIWAVTIFDESLTVNNIVGILVVIFGIMVVVLNE